MRLFALLALLAPIALYAAPDEPLFEGLPPRLRVDLPEREGFVAFEPIANHHAPMLVKLELGSESGTRPAPAEVFEEEFFARLPARERLLATVGADGLERWQYPVGTRIVHRIWLRAQPRRIFELRVMWKRNDGRWGYGLYAPANVDAPIGELVLHRETTKVQVRLAVGPVSIAGTRLHPQSCRACHFGFSAGRHQYNERGDAGPCGFVPQNTAITGAWAKSYARRHGYDPIR